MTAAVSYTGMPTPPVHSYVYEQAGVFLRVDYTLDAGLTVISCRVLGEDYQPVGPDLQHFLHGTCVVLDGGEEAVRLLSLVAEEINEFVPPNAA